MALYALDGVPSYDRPDALRRLWTLFDYEETWEALFAKPPKSPHPMDDPPLWQLADALPLAPATTILERLKKPYPDAHAFAAEMVAGVLLRLDAIDPAIADASKGWRVQRMAQVDRNIMRIGAYELLYCEDVPDAVAINEALELSKQYAGSKARPFINGVLDQIRKSKRRNNAPVVFRRS